MTCLKYCNFLILTVANKLVLAPTLSGSLSCVFGCPWDSQYVWNVDGCGGQVILAHSRNEGSVRDPHEDNRMLRLFIIVPKSYTEHDVQDDFAVCARSLLSS